MSEGPDVKSDEPREGDPFTYRAVSGLAVASLLLGVVSVLAIFAPRLWFLPLLGVFLSVIALVRIAAAGSTLVGRAAALWGLALSILIGTAVPVELLTARWWLVHDAQSTADVWFEALRRGKPFRAHEFSLPADQRPLVDIPLAQYYSGRPEAKEEFKKFLSHPLVRSLLALGTKAEARIYETAAVEKEGDQDVVALVYAITFPDAGGKKSFFVRLTLGRTVNRDTGRGEWRVLQFAGGVRPPTIPE